MRKNYFCTFLNVSIWSRISDCVFYELELESIREVEALAREENEGEEQEDKTEVLESSMNNSISETILNTSVNRSGLTRCTKEVHDVFQQTDSALPMRPKLRVKKNVCTDEIKNTCAQVSTKCEVLLEIARVAVNTVVKCLHDHNVHLNIEEKLCNDKENIREPPSKVINKRQSTDYGNYAYVLPSAKTIEDYKQMQVAQVERNTGFALSQSLIMLSQSSIMTLLPEVLWMVNGLL